MKGPSKSVIYGLLIAYLIASLHLPLPANFTDSEWDRFIMHIMEGLLRIIHVYPTRLCKDVDCELLWMRGALEAMMLTVGPWKMTDSDVKIKDFMIDRIPARVYIPYNRSNDGAIIYVHGGGFVLGTINMYESVIRQVAKNTKMVTFSFDYRLAPEHVFPAALDDCEHVVLEIITKIYKIYGINRNRVALMGDSAGGGLIASLTYRLRHRKDIIQPKIHNLQTPSYEYFYREMAGTGFVDPRLIIQFYLMYAGIDGKLNKEFTQQVLKNEHLSSDVRCSINPYLNIESVPESLRYGRNITSWKRKYYENTSRRLVPYLLNPEFSPIVQNDLLGVPKALVVTMEHDILRDEGILYAKRLQDAGIPTTWKHFATGFHAMINFHNIIATSGRAVKFISDWAVDNI